jgi:hypothetical protein
MITFELSRTGTPWAKYTATVRQLLQSLALISALEIAAGILSSNTFAADAPHPKICTLIDNDFDIDDLMALPVVIGSEPVIAVIQTEGYTEPAMAAPAVDAVLHGTGARNVRHRIALIVGSRPEKTPDLSSSPWVPFFRSMLNRANGFLDAAPQPWAQNGDYLTRIAELTEECDSIRLLLIGPYTSFVQYYPVIQNKVSRIVISGQKMGDDSATPHKESFNCRFDMTACMMAMVQLHGKPAFFVDIPRFKECSAATALLLCSNAGDGGRKRESVRPEREGARGAHKGSACEQHSVPDVLHFRRKK